jgi:IS605 OrfB family transposase
VAGEHENEKNQRSDLQHKLARYQVDYDDLIVAEKLYIHDPIVDGLLAHSIRNASWSSLDPKLAQQAVRAGKLFVQVDPSVTR